MKRSEHIKRDRTAVSLVGKQVSSTTYDEVFLKCTDGYCIFDEHQNLQAFSSDYPQLYPAIIDDIVLGMSYAELMRAFYDKRAVQNMDAVDSPDEWHHHALSIFEQESAKYTHHLDDGRWMQINVSHTSTGHWLFVAIDITSLRESQNELLESHKRYRSLAHLAMDWFWVLDADLRYVYHSSHKQSLSGFDGKDLVGKLRSESLVGRAVDSEELTEHNRALEEHRLIDLVLEWRSGDDQIRYVNVYAKPEFDTSGEFTGYMAVAGK